MIVSEVDALIQMEDGSLTVLSDVMMNILKLPPIEIKIQGKTIKFEILAHLVRYCQSVIYNSKRSMACTTSLRTSMIGSDYYLFGTPFFEAYYLIFDRDKKRIGMYEKSPNKNLVAVMDQKLLKLNPAFADWSVRNKTVGFSLLFAFIGFDILLIILFFKYLRILAYGMILGKWNE